MCRMTQKLIAIGGKAPGSVSGRDQPDGNPQHTSGERS